MKCIQCGHLNPEEYRFCEECGAEFAQPEQIPAELQECPNCAHRNLPEYRFCEECGETLIPAEAPAPEPERVLEPIVAEPVVEATSEKEITNLLACPACAHQNPLENRFCEECGEALITEEVLAPEPEPVEEPFVAQPAVEIARAVELPHVEPELPITYPHAPISSRLAILEAKVNKLWRRLNARRATRLLTRLAIVILAVFVISSGINRFRHPVTENSAKDMARTTINAYYPVLADVDPTVMEYEDQGEELISFSYMKNVSLKTQDGTDLEYTTGAVVIVNRDTGEIQVINTQ
jgi:DNA-directed RNA polymerase subunit RPC12/RpoP